MPAFGRARWSRLAGLASGNPEKAADVAPQTGVDPAYVRSCETIHSIADDPEIDAKGRVGGA